VPAGTLSALLWRFPAGIISVTPLMRIFNAANTALVIGNAGATSLAFDTSTAGQFNAATLPTPLSLSAGTYRATVNTTRYVFRSNFFGGGSITRGSITAVQGRFGSPGSAPASTSTAAYLPDIDFTPTATGVIPTSLAVPVSLGAPTASVELSVAPASLAVPVSLGAPTASVELSASPAALSIPVSLGDPAIRFVARPAPLAVPVSLGAPTVTRVNTSGANWSDFAGIIEGARQDAALNAERRRNPVDCPEHGWPLETNSRGTLHCQFGGHVVTPGR
jgi:hypothetical protein